MTAPVADRRARGLAPRGDGGGCARGRAGPARRHGGGACPGAGARPAHRGGRPRRRCGSPGAAGRLVPAPVQPAGRRLPAGRRVDGRDRLHPPVRRRGGPADRAAGTAGRRRHRQPRRHRRHARRRPRAGPPRARRSPSTRPAARAALATLPVAACAWTPRRWRRCARWVSTAIGQLLAAPRAPLAKRFGAAVLRRLDQATGAVPEPIEPTVPPDLPRTRQGFPEPIATPRTWRASPRCSPSACATSWQQARPGRVPPGPGVPARGRRGAGDTHRHRAAHAGCRPSGPPAERADRDHRPRFRHRGRCCLSAPLTAGWAPPGARRTLAEAAAPDLSGLVDTLTNRLGRTASSARAGAERRAGTLPARGPAAGPRRGRRLARPPAPAAAPVHPAAPVEAMALLPDHAPVRFTWRRRRIACAAPTGRSACSASGGATTRDLGGARLLPGGGRGGQRFWLFRRGDGETRRPGICSGFCMGCLGEEGRPSFLKKRSKRLC